MKKTICIILARGGSKGLKDKNLQLLDGKPLIARPIIDAINSNSCDHIFVSTDSEEIAKVAIQYGAEVPFLRPHELAQDLTTTEDTLKQALISFENYIGYEFDLGVFITATDIFRNVNFISEAIKILNNNPIIESVFTGSPTHKNYWRKNDSGKWERVLEYMKVYSSRQIRPYIVREDTGITCVSRAYLWREGRRIGDNVEIIINDDVYSHIDIHSQSDLDLANLIIKLKNK